MTKPTDHYRPGPHWFAMLGTAFTWPLLFVGGLVTTYKVGMAVPDWPTTFHVNMFLYDMTRASWAVFGEHSHRLYASAVGFFTILLAGEFLIFERRRWMKGLGVLALVLVIAQGVLGGYRVLNNSTMLAAFHGCLAQAFFGLMAALCVLTGRRWFGPAKVVARASNLRRQTVAMVGLVYGQVMIGAWLRHYSDVNALIVHAILAVLVLGHGAGMIAGIERRRAELSDLVPASRTMAVALIFQIGLGIGAWLLLRPYDGVARAVSIPQALIRTGHQANAGLLLASAMILALRSFGQIVPDRPADRPDGVLARDLEAVA